MASGAVVSYSPYYGPCLPMAWAIVYMTNMIPSCATHQSRKSHSKSSTARWGPLNHERPKLVKTVTDKISSRSRDFLPRFYSDDSGPRFCPIHTKSNLHEYPIYNKPFTNGYYDMFALCRNAPTAAARRQVGSTIMLGADRGTWP